MARGNWSAESDQAMQANFKTRYVGRSNTFYSTSDSHEGKIKKTYNFTGKKEEIETILSFSGGYGAGKLPLANSSLMGVQEVTAKKVYFRVNIDREGMMAASSTEGAFEKYTDFQIEQAVRSYGNQCGRIAFGDSTGVLGRGAGATNVTGAGTDVSPYVVTLRAAGFKQNNFHLKQLVQIVTGLNANNNLAGAMEGGDSETNILEVVGFNPATRQVSLVGTSAHLAGLAGANPLATTTGLVPQRSYLREPMGYENVLKATTGSLYGIPVQEFWKAGQINAGGAGLVVDMINEAMLEREFVFGEAPDLIYCHWKQYQKLLAQLEDKKIIMTPNANVKGHMGFKGVLYDGFGNDSRPTVILRHRHANEDAVYLLNSKFLRRAHRPKFGWFTEDGTKFLRVANEDEYEARYGGYFENVIPPTPHAIITGLSV